MSDFMVVDKKDGPISMLDRLDKTRQSANDDDAVAVSLGAGWIHAMTRLTIMVCLGLYLLCMSLPSLDPRNKGLYGDVCLYSALVAAVCIMIQALDYLLVMSNAASKGGLED